MNQNLKETIHEAAAGVYRILVPLPKNPLRFLNAYLIRGDAAHGGRNLLIDTGFNRPECETVLRGALKALNADPGGTDIFVTHLHSDHCGLMKKMASAGSRIYCSKADGDLINYATTPAYWEELDGIYAHYGYPSRGKTNMENHPGWEYNVREKVNFIPVDEGQTMEYGGYTLRSVWTPGHTPGHMCLYDGSKQLLFCADHVLDDITPNITVEVGMDNPLRLYLDSLGKVETLDVRTALTGHRRSPDSFRKRIAELRAHHIARLEELIGILGTRAMNAYEAAAAMHWDVSFDRWEDFPLSQKWFAAGEAIAHLQYLYGEGRINRFESEGVYFYSRD
ncbi:MAG: MBL fold metallo-hydrolase [Clostridiales Family XIII bacterium]|jgi:glyoxylase-like metal-dependent hydrolase (beta-lactamase superfamily II)|nr:MBL fold metallo-hydrolase [Clostridiales Family XIII bacterium]